MDRRYGFFPQVDPSLWKMICSETNWILHADVSEEQVKTQLQVIIPDHLDQDEDKIAWMVFTLCFRSMWNCVRKGRSQEWFEAFGEYAWCWLVFWETDKVMMEAAQGTFILKRCGNVSLGNEILKLLAIADPDQVDGAEQRIPKIVEPLAVVWVDSRPRAVIPTMVAGVKFWDKNYTTVHEQWKANDLKLEMHRIHMGRPLRVYDTVSVKEGESMWDYYMEMSPVATPSSTPNESAKGKEVLGLPDVKPSNARRKTRYVDMIHWNVRGIVGHDDFKLLLRAFVGIHKPDLVFLSETKLSGIGGKNVLQTLGFNCLLMVDAVGSCGGMALLWNEFNVNVFGVRESGQLIHVIVQG